MVSAKIRVRAKEADDCQYGMRQTQNLSLTQRTFHRLTDEKRFAPQVSVHGGRSECVKVA